MFQTEHLTSEVIKQNQKIVSRLGESLAVTLWPHWIGIAGESTRQTTEPHERPQDRHSREITASLALVPKRKERGFAQLIGT